MTMLQSRLENQIYMCMGQRSDCTLIVMHPATWRDLHIEVLESDNMAINRHDPTLKYKGIKVMRSYDIPKGEFEVR